MATLVERAIGAAKLDPAVYEDVEADPSALGEAMTVVVAASVAAGIGAAQGGIGALIGGVVLSLVGWFLWAGVIFVVGTMLLPEPKTDANLGQLLRTLGFAAAPGVLNVLGIVPVVGAIVGLVAAIWQLAAMVVAVRSALDYTSTGRAIGVCLIGFVAYMIVAFVIVGSVIAVGAGAGAVG